MKITFDKVTYRYGIHKHYYVTALKDISYVFQHQKITAIIGESASGKTTLIQHINAILLPTEGKILIDDNLEIHKKKLSKKVINKIRSKVGILFQFAEHQLFNDTVEKDIMFGPLNFGISKAIAKKNAAECLHLVGLEQEYLNRSPFDLSGGQKRRVAIAGILATNSECIILDELTTGLDPAGTFELINIFKKLNTEQKKTLLLITHHMEQILELADDVVVLKDGKIVQTFNSPFELFDHPELVTSFNLTLPWIYLFKQLMKTRGIPVETLNARNMEQFVEKIYELLKDK